MTSPTTTDRSATLPSFSCPECGFVYDEATGNAREGFPPGTPFADVPDDWSCPDCGVRDKVDFEPVTPGAAAS